MSTEQILVLLKANVAAKVALPKFHTSATGRNKFTAMIDKVHLYKQNAITLGELIVNELNQILIDNEMKFENEEAKQDFIRQFRPHFESIMKSHITI